MRHLYFVVFAVKLVKNKKRQICGGKRPHNHIYIYIYIYACRTPQLVGSFEALRFIEAEEKRKNKAEKGKRREKLEKRKTNLQPQFVGCKIGAFFTIKLGKKCQKWSISAHEMRCGPYIYIYIYIAKASFSAYVLGKNLLKTGDTVHFSTKKSTTNFGLPFCSFPFPFCLKMAKICCFCLAKSQKTEAENEASA